MDDLQVLLDHVALPRITFRYPELLLDSSSEMARDFLPTSEGEVPSQRTNDRQIQFDHIFRPTEQVPVDVEWVDRFAKRCADADFESPAVIQLVHADRVCACTIFITHSTSQQAFVHVLLLTYVDTDAALHSYLGQRVAGNLASHADAENQAPPLQPPLSANEAFDILENISTKVHTPLRGRRVLTEDELRYLVDDSPDIAFVASAAGDIIWFNKRWYRYVSGKHLDFSMGLVLTPVPCFADRTVSHTARICTRASLTSQHLTMAPQQRGTNNEPRDVAHSFSRRRHAACPDSLAACYARRCTISLQLPDSQAGWYDAMAHEQRNPLP